MKNIRLAVFLPLLALMCGCEVEFSPNAEWKEVPVVYCVLDQDDDTTWVRVERCYLTEGNIEGGATVSDSINYPQGSLQVALLAYLNDRLMDSIPFEYTVVDHAEGNFVADNQPVYYAPTNRRLREEYTYVLRVRRAADQSILASATTTLLVRSDPYAAYVLSPNSSTPFGFSVSRNCKIEWRSIDNARYYQPIVRFYYKYKYLGDDTLYLDFPCNTRVCTPPYASSYSIQYSRDAFLSGLREYFEGDTNTKIYPELFDIYVTACNEELYAYLHSVGSLGGVEQNTSVYTNIEGGLGVFAARRARLYRRVPGDPSDRTGVGLHALLKEMGVGFI